MQTVNKKVVTTVLLVAIILGLDLTVKLPYFLRALVKIVLFGIIPYYCMKRNNIPLPNLKRGKNFRFVAVFSAAVILLFSVGFVILFKFGFLNLVKDNLDKTFGVGRDNYIYVYLYIIFVNGPLEEFFFRHFSLKLVQGARYGILLSSVLFAVYHVGMLVNMFVWYLFILSIIGLVIVGEIFSRVNVEDNSILNSVVIHMTANFCINTIGLVVVYNLL